MAQTEGGQLLRSIGQAEPGGRFVLHLSDGRIHATADTIEQLGLEEAKGGSYEREE